MRIAHVVSTYPPYRGGMGAVADTYAKRLRERGHEVTVFTPEWEGQAEREAGVERLKPMLRYGNAAVLPQLRKWLDGFDVVHLHYPFFGGALPTVLSGEAPRIMTYHMDPVAGGIRGGIFKLYQRAVLPFITRRVERIFVSSTDYAETSALARIRGAMDKVTEQPFGVDFDRFYPGEAEGLRTELGIDKEAKVMLFVGGLDPAHHFKGVDVLLRALRDLERSDWVCVIVGSGSLRASLEATVETQMEAGRIHFVGSVSDEALPNYYRMADVHLFPSTERAEAFGLVALEAAASGTPSIASDLPGVRTVVADGETGVLVPPRHITALREAIRDMLANDERRIELGERAAERAREKFSRGPLIDRLEETYESVQNT
jgi:glycosyltransferase involved in cell wall biosynthesis